jgi:putative flippase GtrA
MMRAGTIAAAPRYAVVAGSCLILHNLIMITADHFGLTMWQAAATSFCIMVVTGYLLLCLFVFRGARSWRGFFRYATAMAANFPLSTGLLWLLFMPLHQPMAIAAPTVTVVMVVINYLASHWAITGKRPSPSLKA